jgi:hypothetical protein
VTVTDEDPTRTVVQPSTGESDTRHGTGHLQPGVLARSLLLPLITDHPRDAGQKDMIWRLLPDR